MSKKLRNVLVAVCTATALWFYMFSPWTGGWPNFWLVMAMSAIILTSLGLIFSGGFKNLPKIEKPLLQSTLGVVIAFALWGIFWIGDKASSAMFDFARPEVNAVYAMKEGFSPAVIAVLLILLGLFVVTFTVYIFNLDMKLTAAIEPWLLKHYDRIERDAHL